MAPDSARRAAGAAVAVLCAAVGASAAARPLQLEDLLQREAIGAAAISPDGRWAVLERRAPYAQAARFDYERLTDALRTTLWVSDLRAGGPLRPLFPAEPGCGYAAGPVSPDGRRMAVYRLKAGRWQLGLADLAAGTAAWLDLTPDLPERGRVAQWVAPNRLVVLALAPGETPFALRVTRPHVGAQALRDRSAAGDAGVTVLGSGGVAARPADPPKRLVEVRATDGAMTVLAVGAFEDLEVSPSGRRIALLEAGEDIALAPGQPVQGGRGTELRVHRLRLLRRDTGELTTPTPLDVLPQLLSWSAGEELLVFGRPDGALWREGRLLRIDAAGRAAAVDTHGVLPDLANRPVRVRAGWLAGTPILYGRRAGAPRADWFRLRPDAPHNLTAGLEAAPRDGLAVSGGRLLAVSAGGAWRLGGARPVPVEGVEPAPPAGPTAPARYGLTIAEAPRLVLRRRGLGQDVLTPFDATGPGAPVAAPAGAELLAQGGPGLLVRARQGGGAEAILWLQPGATPRTLARLNVRLAEVETPRVVPVRHPGPAGEALTSWLMLPPRPTDGGPPPLVVWPYPGAAYPAFPASLDVRNGGGNETPALLVGHGYAVLVPSLPTPRASAGPAAGLAGRVLGIVAAAQQQPDLRGAFDPERLGLWGFSFGGYGALAILTQTDRFKAAVVASAPADLFSMHGDFGLRRLVWPQEGPGTAWSAGWTEDLQGDMRAPPWRDPQRYLANSPALQAGRIRTPVMIAHGELDSIPVGQAQEMFSALYREGRPAQLAVYWGEGHVNRSPGNLRDYYARAFAWLDARLKP